MVLKRKRGEEFIAYEPGQTATATEVSPKRPRRNPPRSKADASVNVSSTTSETRAVPAAPAKPSKPRAPRKKKAAVTSQEDVPLAGPSTASNNQASSSSSAVAKGKGKKAANKSDGPIEEKRKAQFKSHCPQNILERVERVMHQRIFMIDRTRIDNELKEEYSILGSTGNVYTVTIDHLPRCNCPDAQRGNHCKHILFVFLKVLQVQQNSSLWYQKALLTSELETIFSKAPLAPQARASHNVIEEYARATGKTPVAAEKESGKKRMPGEDDDCPICYDGMQGAPEASLVFCEQCGNALHTECFGEWRKTAQRNGKELTCVWCRASWVVPGPTGGAAKKIGTYLNLAGAAGMSGARDTSTYYQRGGYSSWRNNYG